MAEDRNYLEMNYMDDVREYLQSCGLEFCDKDEVYEQNPAWQLAQMAVDERPSSPSDFEKKYFIRD